MADMKSMKQYIRAIFAATICMAAVCGTQKAGAQTQASTDSVVSIVNEIRVSDCIRIEIPDKLSERLTRIVRPGEEATKDNEPTATKAVRRAGYRILAFDDNNPRTAQARAQGMKRMIESKFPDYRAYVSFNSPYWKVKVGDFRSRGEAEEALHRLRSAMPSMSRSLRIIRDRIN